MKVIIAGASVGGLLLAYKLGKTGNDVVVFDKKDYINLGYDWYDFVWPDFFDKLDMNDIRIDFFRKNNMSFEIHGYEETIRLNQKEGNREYAVNRRQLSKFLYEKASEFAKINLSATVDSPVTDGNSVKGIVAEGEEHCADLVIDNLGVFSPLRRGLPSGTNIEREINAKNIMFAYRAFFKKEGSGVIKDDTKCYLRHLGEDGISWVNIENGGAIDVLVGRIGALSLEGAEGAVSQLKKENPYIGEKISGGGRIYAIPVSHPATKLFCEGYAMIGDSGQWPCPCSGAEFILLLRRLIFYPMLWL